MWCDSTHLSGSDAGTMLGTFGGKSGELEWGDALDMLGDSIQNLLKAVKTGIEPIKSITDMGRFNGESGETGGITTHKEQEGVELVEEGRNLFIQTVQFAFFLFDELLEWEVLIDN